MAGFGLDEEDVGVFVVVIISVISPVVVVNIPPACDFVGLEGSSVPNFVWAAAASDGGGGGGGGGAGCTLPPLRDNIWREDNSLFISYLPPPAEPSLLES